MHQASGDYEQLPGWDEDITECREETELPQNARDYLQYISDFVGVPIALIGVGPGRDQVIWTEAGREIARGQRGRHRLSDGLQVREHADHTEPRFPVGAGRRAVADRIRRSARTRAAAARGCRSAGCGCRPSG